MKEYEIVCTYLNGCAGEAHPLTSFEEAQISDPADYIKQKHPHDFENFTREEQESDRILYTFDNGTIRYLYEFTEI